MTNPQDPNQPGGPAPQGWGQPDPNQPGWAAPAPNAAPGWGAPPAQPTWGQPPAQPGWGAPPPQDQPPAGPGWGAPPPPGYQPAPGWGAPVPPKKKGHGCLIAFVIVLIIFLVGVGSCTAFVVVNAVPVVQTTLKIQSDLGGPTHATVTFETLNGERYWLINLTSLYPHDAKYAACNVVGPDLRASQYKNDGFRVEDMDGNVATDTTPCP